MNEKSIKSFGANIQKLITKQNLSKEETYKMFSELMLNLQPDLQQGAFLAALVSKGETIDEIVGAWQAICEYDTVEISIKPTLTLFENSGTGMDSFKTFNVSSAAAIVAAACGVTMARHGARALTSTCGTVDILESLGLDVECDASIVARSIETVGIGLFNGMSPKIHPGGLGRILSQIRFGSTLNIAASLANPAKPTLGLRGVYAESLVSPVCDIMKGIGYKRGMVVHGKVGNENGGIDELSLCGKTIIKEFDELGIGEMYEISPEDVGLKTVSYSEIATTGNLNEESARFLRVLSGNGEKACVDFTCLNAGAILYVSGKVASLKAGVEFALNTINSGKAIEKLREWIAVQQTEVKGQLEKLERKLDVFC